MVDEQNMKPTAYLTKGNDLQLGVVSKNLPLMGCDWTPLYAIPEGYKLVPIEPTAAMVSRANPLYDAIDADCYRYKEMITRAIEAAPKIEDI